MSENLLDQYDRFEPDLFPQGPITIHEVQTDKAKDQFIDFPFRLFRDSPFWTPPIKWDIKTLLNPLKHPFHKHADVQYFLALREGKVVGRIAAIDNYAHRSFHNEDVGFFGFLDAQNDKDVFDALLQAARTWLKKRGLNAMRGPCSFSTNEECGCLIEGFEMAPAIMTPWNPSWYPKHLESCGLEKAEDLICYWIGCQDLPRKMFKIARHALTRLEREGHTVTIRALDKSRWKEEVEHIKQLYNKAWEKNWGFIPLTEDEMDFIAKELKHFVDPELILFVEVNGETAGFELTLPDYNEILRHLKGKIIGPRQIATALSLMGQIRRSRILMMGVLPEFRNKGLELMLYVQLYYIWKKRGIGSGELSWILERNTVMNKIIRSINGREYRRYRIYETEL